MTKEKIPYLLFERGRYYYQRRVPERFQPAIGLKKWREPAGADFTGAVDKVRSLTKQHNLLLDKLNDPEEFRLAKTNTRRKTETQIAQENERLDSDYENWLIENGHEDPEFFGRDEVSQMLQLQAKERPWEVAKEFMAGLEKERTTYVDLMWLQNIITYFEHTEGSKTIVTLPPFEEYKEAVSRLPCSIASHFKFEKKIPEPMDDDEYHDRLKDILQNYFGSDAVRPTDPDDQDEFDLCKQKLERKIARVAHNPDTLSKISERYYSFAQIKPRTRDKYRRTLKRLTNQTGDVPLRHLTPELLRGFRDSLASNGNLPASIRADFTPIIGMLNFAVDEGLLEASPMSGVRLPKEKRAIEESKWLPFKPDEMRRIFKGVDEVWSRDLQGLSAERRAGLQIAVRALAYTAMRPSELLALLPEDIDEQCIRIRGGKTKSAWRVIPLHPEIATLPNWIKNGGLSVFYNRETGKAQSDPVTVLRYNFSRLTRELMSEPILGERKAMYSLRSTFQNALRRAGAPIAVRKAIMGHVEKGAIRHYDDGPEFELLKHWVELADPTVG